ncbi:MAG: DUF6531 domain-containing protein, partial [Polyangiaceae bacterium]|nr:DUF6531 domain-containing protein [Polyangiaceae bacterium]
MNPGTFVMGGGGAGGGKGGRRGGRGGKGGGKGGDGQGEGASGGGKNAGACGPGSGGGCPNPSHGKAGGTSAGDPVDPITGRVYTIATIDLALPGPLPLVVARSYSSDRRDEDVGLGFGWSHSLAWQVHASRRSVRVFDPLAAVTEAPLPNVGEPLDLPGGRLTRTAWGWLLATGGLVRVFDQAQGKRWLLGAVVDRHGNRIALQYDDGGRLALVVDSAGRVVRVRRAPDGRIGAFEVAHPSGHGGWSFRSYRYDAEGDLVGAADALGHEERFAYDAHRLMRRDEPGGLAAHFRYDQAERCVEAWCERPGNDALDEGVPTTLAGGDRPAKGFLHVALEYSDDELYSEVRNSRTVLRLEGNALDKADTIVWAGAPHRYTYDGAGRVLGYTDARQNTWAYARDDDGRLLAVTDPL